MADIYRLRGDPHEEVQALLPWYINCTLRADEAEVVESHLAECAECRAELEQERKLALNIASLPLDPDEGWAAMVQKMSESPFQAKSPFSAGFFGRKVPIGWAIGAPLAVAASVALVLGFVQTRESAGQTYRALSSPAAAHEGNVVVLFKPDTSAQQLQGILSTSHARIVDGPNSAGALVLRIAPEDRDRALRELRSASQVVLAEPIGSAD